MWLSRIEPDRAKGSPQVRRLKRESRASHGEFNETPEYNDLALVVPTSPLVG
jgi:hypothetical protein